MLPDAHITDIKKTQAVIELGRSWVKICKQYGLDKARVKQIAESIIALEDWEKK
jgi:hypothetical protein